MIVFYQSDSCCFPIYLVAVLPCMYSKVIVCVMCSNCIITLFFKALPVSVYVEGGIRGHSVQMPDVKLSNWQSCLWAASLTGLSGKFQVPLDRGLKSLGSSVNGVKLPFAGLWLNASKSEFTLKSKNTQPQKLQ